MSINDVNDVCTDADIENELSGSARLEDILPKDWVDAEQKRQVVFDRILSALKNRTPPITESSLADLSELTQVVAYGTIADLMFGSFTTEGDKFHIQAKHWDARYVQALNALRPTVTALETAAPWSITISRR